MCGIFGIINFHKKEIKMLDKQMELMQKILNHRGPDFSKYCSYNDRNLALGHNRLSIIDLNIRSSQPLEIKDLVLLFNGEIYNFIELKKDLKDKWDFKTKSDSEVILAMYYEYGEEFITKLDGMFVLLIFDKKKNKILIFRDEFGIKPLYYSLINNNFYFASELKAIMPFIKNPKIDNYGLSQYLILQYQIDNSTLIEGVKTLLPGEKIIIDLNKKKSCISRSFFYRLEDNLRKDFDCKDINNEVYNKIKNSIELQTRSDVPITSYASGGIDSSIVSIIASKKKEIPEIFNGFFSGFAKFSELCYAKEVEKSINNSLIPVPINYESFLKNIKDIIYFLDYPIAGPGSYPQFIVSNNVSKKYKVVLGGQGGDEIFGGYIRYFIPFLTDDDIRRHKIFSNYDKLINKFKSNKDFAESYFSIIDRSEDLKFINKTFLKRHKNKIFNSFLKIFNNFETDNFNKCLLFDLKYSLPSLLHVEDRMSMANSIESRVPLIQKDLINYVINIPKTEKLIIGDSKPILKKAFKNTLPSKILNRKDKMGFPVPLNIWIKNDLKNFFSKILRNLKKRKLDFIKEDFEFNFDKYSREPWILISLEVWLQIFFDEHTFFNFEEADQ